MRRPVRANRCKIGFLGNSNKKACSPTRRVRPCQVFFAQMADHIGFLLFWITPWHRKPVFCQGLPAFDLLKQYAESKGLSRGQI
jgi:hypothetical protein